MSKEEEGDKAERKEEGWGMLSYIRTRCKTRRKFAIFYKENRINFTVV